MEAQEWTRYKLEECLMTDFDAKVLKEQLEDELKAMGKYKRVSSFQTSVVTIRYIVHSSWRNDLSASSLRGFEIVAGLDVLLRISGACVSGNERTVRMSRQHRMLHAHFQHSWFSYSDL